MTDAEIVDRIDRLAQARQEIYRRHSRADRRDGDVDMLTSLRSELAQCWGDRRAARAARDAERFDDEPTYAPASSRQPARTARHRRR